MHRRDPRLWHSIIHPADLAGVIREEREHYRTHTGSVQEYRLLNRDGRMLWVRDPNSIRTDPAGRNTSLMAKLMPRLRGAQPAETFFGICLLTSN